MTLVAIVDALWLDSAPRNPDATAAEMMRAIEAVHPFADIADAVLAAWANHSTSDEYGGEG